MLVNMCIFKNLGRFKYETFCFALDRNKAIFVVHTNAFKAGLAEKYFLKVVA